MPYKVEDKNVMHQVKINGILVWKVKQHCRSHGAAVRAKRLLDAIDHGYKPD
jgi:hypothetical protein